MMAVCIADNQDGSYSVTIEDMEAAEGGQTFPSKEEALQAAAQMLDEASMAPPQDASQIEPDEGMPEEEMAPDEEADAMTQSFQGQRTPFKPMTR